MVPSHIYCNCYAQAKYTIWVTVTRYLDGCDQQMIANETGLSVNIIDQCLEDLHVEDKVFLENGRWYPEMGVS